MSPALPAATAWLAGRGPLVTRMRGFERYLGRALPAAGAPPGKLHAAMRYAVLGPGKRLRPLLVLTACEAVGGPWQRALPAAAAVELVHAFSLVHDDLPAMDDDDFRRGRPTTHRRFGEALGLLAGDALLALAFEVLVDLGERGMPPAGVARAVRVLAEAAGSRVLVGGQVLDLMGEGPRRMNGRAVREIHLRKTGGLISAALVLGGLAGGAPAARLRDLASIGLELGFAFQIGQARGHRRRPRQGHLPAGGRRGAGARRSRPSARERGPWGLAARPQGPASRAAHPRGRGARPLIHEGRGDTTEAFWFALAIGFLIQGYKGFSDFVHTRHWNLRRFVETGGMPSSHAASVSSLSTMVGLHDGFRSSLFAVTLFFSLIVMYDAAGLRRAAG
ncbi:MAG: hypothetical protein E6K81_06485, partial [Candidatus Eisenbacteria bacterium]